MIKVMFNTPDYNEEAFGSKSCPKIEKGHIEN